ncbi:MAG: translation initiation factor IF-3 [Candidatus Latescibacterota bacterium]|nr:translation initiation factor IF-3 [Candidatus Latescibacterota bacterium]
MRINRGFRGRGDRGRPPAREGPRINEQIRIPQIHLIDAEGEQIGVVETKNAQIMADEAGLDLVEVAPNARPPVCKIMDYGKYRYEQSKKQKKGKQAGSQLKEIRMRVRISSHDFDFKVKHAEDFLKQRHKVRMAVMFSGRENAHRELGRELLDKIAVDLAEFGTPEAAPRNEGRAMVITMVPK